MPAETTLLVIGAGIEACPGILRAKEMGLHVVASDQNPEAPGFALADDRLLASTYDIAGTLEKVRQYHRTIRRVDGVICIATDVPLTVASVAADLGLPGIPLEAAQLAMDKLAMKERFARDCVPVPRFREVSSGQELRQAATEIGTDLVVKPVDSRGARGVLRLHADSDLDWAFRYALGYSPSRRVIVEEYLDGPQVSTESLVVDGKVFTPGFSDRNYEFLDLYAPHIIENGGELPSHLPESVRGAVREQVAAAARSMGIINGVVKGDIVVHRGRPHVIELAARLSGGYFCSHEIPLNTGVDFVGAAIRVALGDKPDPAELIPRFETGVAQRYLFPAPGIVKEIAGVENVARRPEIALCEIRIKVGDRIAPVESHPGRAGVVLATGADRGEAMANVKRAIADIRIRTAAE